jgi:hypothetical protein
MYPAIRRQGLGFHERALSPRATAGRCLPSDGSAVLRHPLREAEIAVTQITCASSNKELAAPVACEDAYLATLQVYDWPKRPLRRDDKSTRAGPLKAGPLLGPSIDAGGVFVVSSNACGCARTFVHRRRFTMVLHARNGLR